MKGEGSKRRRKKFKHKLLEEGWGEQPLPKQQGATQGTPQDLEQEQKQQQGELLDRVQDQEIVLEGEQESMEQMGGRIPGEQSLVQLKLTDGQVR